MRQIRYVSPKRIQSQKSLSYGNMTFGYYEASSNIPYELSIFPIENISNSRDIKLNSNAVEIEVPGIYKVDYGLCPFKITTIGFPQEYLNLGMGLSYDARTLIFDSNMIIKSDRSTANGIYNLNNGFRSYVTKYLEKGERIYLVYYIVKDVGEISSYNLTFNIPAAIMNITLINF